MYCIIIRNLTQFLCTYSVHNHYVICICTCILTVSCRSRWTRALKLSISLRMSRSTLSKLWKRLNTEFCSLPRESTKTLLNNSTDIHQRPIITLAVRVWLVSHNTCFSVRTTADKYIVAHKVLKHYYYFVLTFFFQMMKCVDR